MKIDIKALESAIADAINHPSELLGVCLTVKEAQAVLSMLKEQEAVEPVTESSVYDTDTWFFVCGSCKKGVINCGDKFCRWCGQAVKWNENNAIVETKHADNGWL